MRKRTTINTIRKLVLPSIMLVACAAFAQQRQPITNMTSEELLKFYQALPLTNILPLPDGPVEIEALTDEAEAIEQSSLRVAVIDLYLPDDLEPRRIVLEADAFDKLATENPMDQLLIAARPIRRSPRASVSNGSRGDRPDYATLEHAGKPHKGKVTDTEKQLVRDHLDEINQRLADQGLRTISMADPDHVERYALQEFARDRTSELEFDLEEEERAVAAG